MKIRGDLKVLNDLILPRTGGSTPGKDDILMSVGPDGTAVWDNLVVHTVEDRDYREGSIVLSPDRKNIYSANTDNAPGNDLGNSAWTKIGESNSGGNQIYDISSTFAGNLGTEDIGGLYQANFRVAGDFRDLTGTPNKSISEVLDAIIFKDSAPTASVGSFTSRLLGKYDGAASFINIAGKTLEYGKLLDVRLETTFNQGTWSSGQNYYGPANYYNYILQGISSGDIPATDTGSDVRETIGTVPLGSPGTQYKYDASLTYKIGGVPTTSHGNIHPGQMPPDTIQASTKSIEASAPILVSMLAEKHLTTSSATIYLNKSENIPKLDRVMEGHTIFLDISPVLADVTSNMLGEVKYPYILLPVEHNTSLAEFKDYATNIDYTHNFLELSGAVPINLGYGNVMYNVYVFDNLTSIIAGQNDVKLTVN